jgi:acylphosphatase
MLNVRKKVRKYIRFYGEVQAVGFRYYASTAADRHGATGWVRNEYDGSVSMEIQGSEEQIDSVLSSLEKGTYIKIMNTEVKELEPLSDERRFRVKY